MALTWHKSAIGYASECGRFTIEKRSVCAYRPGCWKTQWRLVDKQTGFVDDCDTLRDAKKSALDMTDDDIPAHKVEGSRAEFDRYIAGDR